MKKYTIRKMQQVETWYRPLTGHQKLKNLLMQGQQSLCLALPSLSFLYAAATTKCNYIQQPH